MRYSKKLELLNNYIELGRILLKCKSILILHINIDAKALENTCKLAIKLQNDCLEKIKQCGMYDDAFEILKKDIDTAIQSNIYTHNLSHNTLEQMNNTLSRLQGSI